MGFDLGVSQRLRESLADIHAVVERRMFGGIVFMVSGHMACGVIQDKLMVRVGKHQYLEALSYPYVREMDFTGKPLNGFVYVDPPGFEMDEDLAFWVERCLRFVTSLPPK